MGAYRGTLGLLCLLVAARQGREQPRGPPSAGRAVVGERSALLRGIVCLGDIQNHILFGYYPVINRPLDMLFNAPTLSFIHTLCVLWAGSKPAYSTIINTHVFNNPTPYYHGRGPMLHKESLTKSKNLRKPDF